MDNNNNKLKFCCTKFEFGGDQMEGQPNSLVNKVEAYRLGQFGTSLCH